MTLLRRALSQIRPVEPDAPDPVDVPMVQIPRHIAELTLDLIGPCATCTASASVHHGIRSAMLRALEEK